MELYDKEIEAKIKAMFAAEDAILAPIKEVLNEIFIPFYDMATESDLLRERLDSLYKEFMFQLKDGDSLTGTTVAKYLMWTLEGWFHDAYESQWERECLTEYWDTLLNPNHDIEDEDEVEEINP